MKRRLLAVAIMRKEHILEFVYGEFAACGFKQVSVDELAARMHISKKTLYEFFSNKEKLFLDAIKQKCGKIVVASGEISEECSNVLEIIIRCSMYLFEAVVGVSAQFKEDVENCEEARIYLKEVRKELLDAGKRRFEQGKVEGYLMEEADFEIVGSMLALQVVKMNEKKSERYTPNQVCLKSLMIILRGVCTEKGREVLDQIKESYTV